MMIIGLRACSSLRIFEPFRVLIQLFKQVFIDIAGFMFLLMMLVGLMAIIYGIERIKDHDLASTYIQDNMLDNIGLFY